MTRIGPRLFAAFCFFAVLAFAQEPDNRGAQGLPKGVAKAMSGDEKIFCDLWLGSYRKGCHRKFRENLWWRQVLITPSGQAAFLVDNRNMSFCGSAGCALYLFKQESNGRFSQILGRDGDVGNLARFKVLEATTEGYYDLQKTWADGQSTTVYRWDGKRYSIAQSP